MTSSSHLLSLQPDNYVGWLLWFIYVVLMVNKADHQPYWHPHVMALQEGEKLFKAIKHITCFIHLESIGHMFTCSFWIYRPRMLVVFVVFLLHRKPTFRCCGVYEFLLVSGVEERHCTSYFTSFNHEKACHLLLLSAIMWKERNNHYDAFSFLLYAALQFVHLCCITALYFMWNRHTRQRSDKN